MADSREVERRGETLTRGIMPWHVTLIALGGIIGSCYFLALGETFNSMGAGAVIIAYIVAGLTIFGVMQSFGELLVNIPRRGSFVSYTREFMGDTNSAGIGWAFWVNWVVYIPSEAIAASIFTGALVKNISGHTATNGELFVYGLVVLALLTLINVYRVRWFGHIESIMAIIKIMAVALFVIFGIVIFLGFIGAPHECLPDASGVCTFSGPAEPSHALGFSQLLFGSDGVWHQLFPSGGLVIITMMIWTLVNFQGSEIVGLSAAETQDPDKNVPLACRRVAYRIILIYLLPILVLSFLMPSVEATLDGSVFAQALAKYGFGWGSGIFTVVTLIAAFSCANSGFYGTVRSLYGLASEGMAPRRLAKLNRFKTPQNATLLTLGAIWIVFLATFALQQMGWFGGENNTLYIALIGISGFTGTLCWVGILLSQIIMRRRLVKRGYDPQEVLHAKAIWFPWLAWFGVVLQLAAMVLLIFEPSDGIPIFVLSMDIIFVPVAVYSIQKYRGKISKKVLLGDDEVLFEDKFPDKTGLDSKVKKPVVIGGGNGVAWALGIMTGVAVVLSVVILGLYPSGQESYTDVLTGEGMATVWTIFVVCVVLYVGIVLSVRFLENRRMSAEPAPSMTVGGADETAADEQAAVSVPLPSSQEPEVVAS